MIDRALMYIVATKAGVLCIKFVPAMMQACLVSAPGESYDPIFP
jgi:hypothetical protein